jgi:hypothetical protein
VSRPAGFFPDTHGVVAYDWQGDRWHSGCLAKELGAPESTPPHVDTFLVDSQIFVKFIGDLPDQTDPRWLDPQIVPQAVPEGSTCGHETCGRCYRNLED